MSIDHPHAAWTEERLGSYIGETETLTLEFKSSKALKWPDPSQRKRQILDAAKDVAAMANEQGGVIVYGIEESGAKTRRQASSLDDGFGPDDTASREWFLQVARDNIQPPLTELDAVQVRQESDPQRFWLVVLVPQATGRARQTGDLLFLAARRARHSRHDSAGDR